jgi:hypothetical protein
MNMAKFSDTCYVLVLYYSQLIMQASSFANNNF